MVFLIQEGVQRVFSGHAFGRGMASYERAAGYFPSEVPVKVGARHFFPDPEYDETTDQAKPAAMGNKWDGGKAAYQQRVYNAAKRAGRKQGLSHDEIDNYKPRQVA